MNEKTEGLVVSESKIRCPPTDTITSIRWSPKGLSGDWNSTIAASSWDGSLRVWRYHRESGESSPLAVLKSDPSDSAIPIPMLNCNFFPHHPYILSSNLDGAVKIWNLETAQHQIAMQHLGPVKTAFVSCLSPAYIVSGSWDHTVRIRDFRSPNNTKHMCLSLKGGAVHALAQANYWLVTATADRSIQLFDVRKCDVAANAIAFSLQGGQERKKPQQIRSLSIISDQALIVGYINGTISRINCFQNAIPSTSTTVDDCPTSQGHIHSSGKKMYAYAINDMDVHPTLKTLATAGSDGRYAFWEPETLAEIYTSPLQIPAFPRNHNPRTLSLTACSFSSDSLLFAFAQGNDYSWGKQETKGETIGKDIDKLFPPQSSLTVKHLQSHELKDENESAD